MKGPTSFHVQSRERGEDGLCCLCNSAPAGHQEQWPMVAVDQLLVSVCMRVCLCVCHYPGHSLWPLTSDLLSDLSRQEEEFLSSLVSFPPFLFFFAFLFFCWHMDVWAEYETHAVQIPRFLVLTVNTKHSCIMHVYACKVTAYHAQTTKINKAFTAFDIWPITLCPTACLMSFCAFL